MITKDYSIEGVIKLIPLTDKPQENSMVAMERFDIPFIIIGETEQDRLDGFMRVKPIAGVQNRAPVRDFRQIVIEYDGTNQLPLDADQWKYVLKHNMIDAKVRFERISEKRWGGEDFNELKLERVVAKLMIDKMVMSREELYELGEMCYNFRIQQEQSKTDVSFREWFKSKFL